MLRRGRRAAERIPISLLRNGIRLAGTELFHRRHLCEAPVRAPACPAVELLSRCAQMILACPFCETARREHRCGVARAAGE
jgi:hypothetical protein